MDLIEGMLRRMKVVPVVWPTQSYIVEAYNQLGNQLHYEQIETNPTPGLAM